MAQDFAAAFGVGDDDRHIHVVDASGVALASIQALHQVVQQQARELQALRWQVEQLRRASKSEGPPVSSASWAPSRN